MLDDIAELLIKEPELKHDIEGHTSSDGTLNANMKLSNERAATVKKTTWLEKALIHPD